MNNNTLLYRTLRFVAAALPTTITTCLSACILSAALGCGGESSEDEPSAGKAGSVSAGKSGGAGAGTAAGAPAAPPPVPCGSKVCSAAANPLTGLLGMFGGTGSGMAVPALPMGVTCCLDATQGTCGTAASQDAKCEGPAMPDPRCPVLNLGVLGAAAGGSGMTGCCTAANRCGIDGSLLNRGCLENGDAKQLFSSIPVVGNFVMFPEPRACDAPPPEPDAGI